MNARRRAQLPSELVFLPLGGTGEIGMNCYCYGAGPADDRRWLMVDLGVKFGEAAEPGIDVVLPDVSFLAENRRKLAGLVVTHAHEDHIGAVPWLWPQLRCPIYCTAFAAQIIALKLKEAGLDEEVKVHVVKPGARLSLGPFDIEFISVTHSIPESTALLIETKRGRVLHSGDWKIDRSPIIGPGMDERRLREIGEAGHDRARGLRARKLQRHAFLAFDEFGVGKLRLVRFIALGHELGRKVGVDVDDDGFHKTFSRIKTLVDRR